MLEIIELATPTEQTKTVLYGDRSIKFSIRWNELKNHWFLDIFENETPLYTGITMTPNSNLLFDILGLGKLFLIDTKYGTTFEPIKKSDLGKRLQLARVYEK